jgi:hypothetical protein
MNLPKGTYIMWDRAEKILEEFKHDHLVIFDCSDGGFLNCRNASILSTRETRHAFDYLVACGGGRFTHGPGPHSFTSALIWALEELKPIAPFTVQNLKDHIKRNCDFPSAQDPLVITHPDHVAGPILIAPIAKSAENPIGRSSKVATNIRPEMTVSAYDSSVSRRRSQDLPSIFDGSNHGREWDSSTLPTTSGETPLEVQINKQTRDVEHDDARTTYSVDSAPDDSEKDYIWAFARQLLQDVESASGITNISKIPSSYISDTLREFSWRLHEESSNPFQWGTSVTLHRNRE